MYTNVHELPLIEILKERTIRGHTVEQNIYLCGSFQSEHSCKVILSLNPN